VSPVVLVQAVLVVLNEVDILKAVGDTFEEARENLYALLEEGQILIVIRTNR
jgi:hypothetical protein